jgi:predicted glycoside hydrolase/deacetylase ChbG (UPF0249 family)
LKRLLVINADDAGVDAHVDRCILTAAREGLLSSASVLANGATARDFIRAAGEIGLGLGLHFNITEGRPISGTDGIIYGPKSTVWRDASHGSLDAASLREEAKAQWQALVRMGAVLDHVDSHNHVHLYTCVLEALLDVLPGDSPLHIRLPFEEDCSTEFSPPFPEPHLEPVTMGAMIRRAGHVSTPHFIGYHFSDTPAMEAIAGLETRSAGACEWMVHPGSRAGSPFTSSVKRDCELDFLLTSDLKQALSAWDVEVVRFGELI